MRTVLMCFILFGIWILLICFILLVIRIVLMCFILFGIRIVLICFILFGIWILLTCFILLVILSLHTGLTNFFGCFYLHSTNGARWVLLLASFAVFWVFFWHLKAAQTGFSFFNASLKTKRILFFETACRTLQSTLHICGIFLLSFLKFQCRLRNLRFSFLKF